MDRRLGLEFRLGPSTKDLDGPFNSIDPSRLHSVRNKEKGARASVSLEKMEDWFVAQRLITLPYPDADEARSDRRGATLKTTVSPVTDVLKQVWVFCYHFSRLRPPFGCWGHQHLVENGPIWQQKDLLGDVLSCRTGSYF